MSEIRVPEDLQKWADTLLDDRNVEYDPQVIVVRLARTIAERDEARKALAAMTLDRDLWRYEHGGDCPYYEQTKVLREALERPVTAMEWSMARLKVGMNGIDIANKILRERAALNSGERP